MPYNYTRDAEGWRFHVLDEDGNLLETSPRAYTVKYGAQKASRCHEITGAMPTMGRPAPVRREPRPAAEPRNPSARRRLTIDEVREIRNSPETGAAVAERFGISRPAVSMIRNRRNYRWLKD